MEQKEATRTCGQCHKEVAEVNFALHETHCSRFLCICPDCDETVPRDQLAQHREEQHTQVRCSKCNKKMERCQLLDHESDECVERLQKCVFCEIELPWKELDEHSLACGSRTELCRECSRYVKLRDLQEHSSTCSATDNSPPPTQSSAAKIIQNTMHCGTCLGSFPEEEIEEHKLQCALEAELYNEKSESEEEEQDDFSTQGLTARLSSTFKAKSLSANPSHGPCKDGSDPDKISTCPHCHLALPVPTLRWHEVKCQVYIVLNP
ncbi:XIAP-associated factor 1 [Parambassis ranga]|uniref:XIAP-associated factor 1 n=1 Tax=Parambassis ranga TaxID=210632 RepID=A0A6P7JFG8_9TELE|nr:XIAP-associated factor 1 [Parambassis ranga]